MGEVICAWFGKIPVVKRENGDAAPHQLCYIFFMRGEWWIDESIQSTPPSRVRGPLRNTIDGYDLARFGPIQWLEWENWVVVNGRKMWQLTGGKESLASAWPAHIYAPPTMQTSPMGTWRCLTCLVLFKFDRWVYYKLSSSVGVLFHDATADVIPMYVNGLTALILTEYISGSQYSLDDGFGRWIGSKRCIAFNVLARTTHALLVHFYCWAEMMQYTQMNRNSYVDKPTMQILDYRQ